GRLEGRPVVALTFDPALSGLEKSLAFPLLMSNATSFLLAQQDSAAAAQAEPFDRSKSDIAPHPVPTLSSFSSSVPTADGVSERWRWLLFAAVGVLGVEWLVFARRG